MGVIRDYMNILRLFLNKFRGILCSMESSEKVARKLGELNTGFSTKPWVPIDGYFSLTNTELKPDGVVFHVDQGLILKTFLNTENGEIRLFPANAFGLDT